MAASNGTRSRQDAHAARTTARRGGTGRASFLALLAAFGLACLTRGEAAAQAGGRAAAGTLRVVVLDPHGAAIAGARVTLSAGGEGERAATTDGRGEALFERVTPGRYRVSVEAAGFAPRELQDLPLRSARGRVEVRLEVAGVREEVSVGQSEQEKRTDPRGPAFSRVLTPEQIAQLPDDPEELEAVLKQMAGPGAVIRVNGFRGGRLPPKSQIRQIRIHPTPYSAEHHDSEFMGIDIVTAPGAQPGWHGTFRFGFRDEALGARHAFAPRRAAEQSRRFGLALDGALRPNRTGLSLYLDGDSAYDSKTILAALPGGTLSATALSPSRTLNAGARLDHALTKTHTLYAEFQRSFFVKDGLGVGNFDLPERAYSTRQTEHLLRVAESGVVGGRFFNEFRAQFRWQQGEATPASERPAVVVLDAFSSGGAGVRNASRARLLEVNDNFDFAAGGKHSLRAGAQFEAASYRREDRQNANGTFTFASLEAFRQNSPTTYTRREGDATVSFAQYQFGWYLQDDVRLRKNLSLSFGLRHEWQSNLSDRNNLAPRFGLAWSPSGDGSTTVRAGGGVYYMWFGAEVLEHILRVDGERQREIVITDPGYPDPSAGGRSIILPPGRLGRDEGLPMPYVAQGSVGVESRLLKHFQFFGEYRFGRGAHLLRSRNTNAPVAGRGRPAPAAGNRVQVEATANSVSHEFNLGLGPSFGGGGRPPHLRRVFWMVHYTWARVTGDADDPFSLPADNYDLRGERGFASTDIRHRLFGMLDLRLLGGLRLATMFSANSGAPYNVTTGFDDNGDTVSNDRPAGVTRNSGRGAAHLNVSTRLGWEFGFGRGGPSGAGPRMVAVRVGGAGPGDIGPAGPGGEGDKRLRVGLYLQVYNLFNRVNPINYTGVLTSPFFGQATGALPARRLETGLVLNF